MPTRSLPRHPLWTLAGYAALAGIALLQRQRRPVQLRGPTYPVPALRPEVAAGPGQRTAGHKAEAETVPQSRTSVWGLVRQAGKQWVDHKDARLGAALAYYSVFSIGPLILIAV